MNEGETRGGDSARAAVDERCPRCDAARGADQRYCVECGLRLPSVSGAVPALRRRWVRRIGWYPGDWIWGALPALVVAIAGAAVSIGVTSRGQASAGTTVVMPAPSSAAGAATAAADLPVGAAGRPAAAEPAGRTVWPSVGSGWTVVLGSYPASAGTRRSRLAATRAARAGLPEVGVLESSGFASLHPGYLVVFSGIYSASTDADTALRTAQARGFGTAYTREIAR